MKKIKSLFLIIACFGMCLFGGLVLTGCDNCVHNYESTNVITQATCTTDGLEEFTCTICGDTKTEVIDALGHSGGEATCSNLAVCETCSEPYGELNASNHNGGTADCTNLAICQDCETPYGSVDLENHTQNATWTKTQTTHKQEFECCDTIVVSEEGHTFENGVCSECEYVCIHTGGEANCHERAVCTNCAEEYGELAPNTHTESPEYVKTATTHQLVYKCCDTPYREVENHNFINGVCSECEYVCLHSGEPANCQSPAICDICNLEYEEINPDKHIEEISWIWFNLEHVGQYNCCFHLGDVIVEPHTFENGYCEICDYTCEHDFEDGEECIYCDVVCHHTGGTADCESEAVCENCNHKYGNKNPENHCGEIIWNYSSDGHYGFYDCCMLNVTEPDAPHNLDEHGHCDICGYTCSHSGGNADCKNKAICELCHLPYGEINTSVHNGNIIWTTTHTTHKGDYDCCGALATDEVKHNFTGNDSTCTECGYVCTEHSGGEAKCTVGAICENCNVVYTEKDPDNHTKRAQWNTSAYIHSYLYKCCNTYVIKNEKHTFTGENGVCSCGVWCSHMWEKSWVQTETTHKQICNECNLTIKEEENHTFTDGVCDVCKYECVHSSTEGATCISSKVCTNCNLRVYGKHQIVPANCWSGETCSVEGCTYSSGTKIEHSYGDDDECEHCGYINNGLLYESTFFVWKSVRYIGYRVYDIGTCTDSDIRISPVYNGQPVISIRWGAFNTMSGSNYAANPKVANGGNFTVTIPSTVMEIGSGAFANANKLTHVYFEEGSNLVQISGEAFRRCTSLEWFVFPKSLKQVGAKAFSSNPNLETFYFESNSVNISSDNDAYNYNKVYYLCQEEPNFTGKVWYYDENGIPTKWFDN